VKIEERRAVEVVVNANYAKQIKRSGIDRLSNLMVDQLTNRIRRSA
jgi:hypothetical protein